VLSGATEGRYETRGKRDMLERFLDIQATSCEEWRAHQVRMVTIQYHILT